MDGRREADRLHRDGEVARPAQEGEALRRDLLRLLRRRGRRPEPAGRVRLQRRARRLVGVPAHGRRRAAAGRLPGRRDAAPAAAAARPERILVARVRRPRLRRSGRHRLQPHHRARQEGRRGEEARAAGRRREAGSGRVLRPEARPRVDLRVHGPLAVRERPLELAGLHRRRELRRLPRRTARAHAAGGDRHRPQRRDPDLPGDGADRSRPERLQRDVVGRPAADDGRRRRLPRPLARVPGRDVPRRRARGCRGVRERRLRHLPHPRRLISACPSASARSRGSRTSSACRSSSSRAPRDASARSSTRASCSATSGRSPGSTTSRSPATDPFPDRPEHSRAGSDPRRNRAGLHGGDQPAAPLGDRRPDRPRVPAPQPRGEPGVEGGHEAALLRAAGGRD